MHRITGLTGALSLLIGTTAAQVPTINTLAGGGPNNVQATTAAIGKVDGIIGDTAGNSYFSGPDRGRVFKVDSTGRLTVVAGTGSSAPIGDGCLAVNATLTFPTKLALDPVRNYLYISDNADLVVRRIALANGVITTVAGFLNLAGIQIGQPIPPVDGIPAVAAALGFPQAVALDSAGNLYISDIFMEGPSRGGVARRTFRPHGNRA